MFVCFTVPLIEIFIKLGSCISNISLTCTKSFYALAFKSSADTCTFIAREGVGIFSVRCGSGVDFERRCIPYNVSHTQVSPLIFQGVGNLFGPEGR